ncbi:MAG: hypothetical protein ACYSTI_05880 [Planctomycetota bacterium]|jgi:hypothetical protein
MEICSEYVWTGALINCAAIIIGVLIAYSLEKQRRDDEDRKTAWNLIQSVQTESENNKEIIQKIGEEAELEKPSQKDIVIYAIPTALTSPLTYRHVPEELIKEMREVSTLLAEYKNRLERHHSSGTHGKSFGREELAALKECGTKCINQINDKLLRKIKERLPKSFT